MRKLIVAEHISLDGVIQSPGGPEEDPSGGFRLGGWTVPYVDEAIGRDLQDLFSQPFESGPQIRSTLASEAPRPAGAHSWKNSRSRPDHSPSSPSWRAHHTESSPSTADSCR